MMRRILSLAFVFALAAMLVPDVMAQPGGGRGGRGGAGFGGFGGFGGRGGGQMDLFTLAMAPPVQKELDMIDAQVEDLKTAREEQANSRRNAAGGFDFQALRNASQEERAKIMAKFAKSRQEAAAKSKAKLKEILFPEQFERLEQIAMQVVVRSAGMLAVLNNDDVSKKLGLSTDQNAQVDKLAEDMNKERSEMFSSLRGQAGRARGGQGGQGGQGGRARGGQGGQGGQGGRARRGPGGPGGNFQEIFSKMEELRKGYDKKAVAVLDAGQKKKLDSLEGAKFELSDEALRGLRGGGRGGFGGRGGQGGQRGQGRTNGRPQRPGGGN